MELLDRLKGATVRIGGPNPGTGYLIASNRVATCHHVVRSWDRESHDVQVGEGDTPCQATVVAANAATDCAVLRLDVTVDNLPLPLASQLLRSNVWWDGYGFPAAAEGVGLPIRGEVLDKSSHDKTKRPILILGAEAAGGAPLHGFSGTAVVVEEAVVGHLQSYIGDPLDRSRTAYNMIYASPIDGIRQLVDVPVNERTISPPVLVRPSRFIAQVTAELSVPQPNDVPLDVTVKAAEKLIGQNRPDLALQVLSRTRDADLKVSQLRARALSNDGRVDEAIQLLEELRESGNNDAETLGLLAGRYKELWRGTRNKASLSSSFEIYSEAYDRTKDPYTGINAAATALWSGLRSDSRTIAGEVNAALQSREKPDHWHLANLGEASLLREEYEAARTWYRKAAAKAYQLPQDIAIMRRQARLDLEAIGQPRNLFDDVLPVPKVLAFAGHMVDVPGRHPSRFPLEKIGDVRQAIRKSLDEFGFVKPFSTAARGSDILFLEEVVKRRLMATVVLPFPEQDFRAVSMGADWERRFDTIRDSLEIQVLAADPPSERKLSESFARSNIEIQRLTFDYAERLDEPPLLLVVWDGKPEGDGPGGTADTVRLWREEGIEPHVIPV